MQSKLTKRVTILIAVIVAAMSMTISASAQTELSISFWGGEGEASVVEAMIDVCEAELGVTVESIWVQGSYEQQVLTMIAGGTAPDLMQISSGSISGFADQFLAPQGVDTSAFAQEASLAGLTVDGELRAIPFVAKSKVMGLNVDVFEAAGVALPSLTEPLSPEAFQEMAISLTSGEGEDRIYGSANLWFGQWLYVFDGNFYNADSTAIIIGLPESKAVEAANFILAAENEFNYAPNAMQREGINTFDWFLAGQVAMWPDFGPWFLPAMAEAEGLNWQIVPVPGGKAPLEINGFGVSATTANPEAAQEFALCLGTSTDAQSALATTWGLGIPVSAAGQEAFVASDTEHNLAAFVTAIENTLIQPQYCQDAQVQSEFYTAMFDRTAMGSGDEAVEDVFAELNTYLNENFACD
jgi:multiple sugar transport system substrate-binding protein